MTNKEIAGRLNILSNGNIHYFWDTQYGNPETALRFPTQESLSQNKELI